MDELYVESFSTQATQGVVKVVPMPLRPVEEGSGREANQQMVEASEAILQFTNYLDQLEKRMFQEYKNFADFEFLLGDIREKLKEKNMEGMDRLLSQLEELLDVS